MKRGRGRPRKNPLPEDSQAIESAAANVPRLLSHSQIVEPVKRGRGRPRKNPSPGSTQPIESAATSIPQLPATANVMGPVKRGRGRPRKKPLPEASQDVTTTALSVPPLPTPPNVVGPVKRGRGRPRKNPLPGSTKTIEPPATSIPQLPAPSDAMGPVKRGRGRPRKVVLTTSRNAKSSMRCPGRPRKYPLPAASRSSAHVSTKRGPRRSRKHSLPGSNTIVSLSGRVTRQSRQRKLPIYLHDFVIVDDGGEVKQQYDAIVPGRSEMFHRPEESSAIGDLGKEDDSAEQMPRYMGGARESPVSHPGFAGRFPEQSCRDDDDVKNGLIVLEVRLQREEEDHENCRCVILSLTL